MPSPFAAVASRLLDVAFPPRCPACGAGRGEPGGCEDGFCAACFGDLPLLDDEVCPRCATPLAGDAPSEGGDCPVCRGERWAFDSVLALGAYDGLLRRLVLDAKRPGGEAAATALGRMLARRRLGGVAELSVAVVTPTPQHWRRRLSRRADGVAALAAGLADAAGLPLWRALRRARATARQTEVAPSDRAANVRGAFAAVRPDRLAGRTVLLVDDVLTTGSTCHAAAQALKQAGAGRVIAVVAARRIGS